MPVELKYKEPVKPVPIAQTPEFKKLQDLIDTAKVSLDDVARQIVVVEAKMIPKTGKPSSMTQDPMEPITSADGVPVPMSQRGFEADPAGQTFEESIEEMRRIAGLR
jgi:hypothetical protein